MRKIFTKVFLALGRHFAGSTTRVEASEKTVAAEASFPGKSASSLSVGPQKSWKYMKIREINRKKMPERRADREQAAQQTLRNVVSTEVRTYVGMGRSVAPLRG